MLVCSHFGDEKPAVTPQLIALKLDARLVTLKVSRPVPLNQNSPSQIENRFQYAQMVGELKLLGTKVIFADESGYSLWTYRRKVCKVHNALSSNSR